MKEKLHRLYSHATEKGSVTHEIPRRLTRTTDPLDLTS